MNTHPPAGHPGPTPERFFNVINGHQQGAALKAAVELDFFTAIGEGHNTVEKLAARCKVATRGARILADHLTVLGFLVKEGKTYRLAEDSSLFLDKNSPAYIGACVEFLLAPAMKENFNHLTDRIRVGGAPRDDQSMLEPNHEVWVRFARGMAGLMTLPAQSLARHVLSSVPEGNKRPLKVLDIAAGHGIYGIAVAQQNPNAQIVGLDWPNVLEVAKEHAAKFGVAGRYSTIKGDAFKVSLGEGYDLVLIPNFLHHVDAETNVGLLRKIHAALKPGGRAVALEFAPNDDRVSPPASAAFALVMLAGTPGGDAYTVSEIKQMFADAGFKNTQWADVSMSMQRAISGEK